MMQSYQYDLTMPLLTLPLLRAGLFGHSPLVWALVCMYVNPAKQERGMARQNTRNFLLSLHSRFGRKLRSRHSTPMDGTEIVSRFDAVGISGMKTATKLLENRLRSRYVRLCETRTDVRQNILGHSPLLFDSSILCSCKADKYMK